jgi:Fe2+ or Zn2+ uptake regulation protein
VSFSGGSTRGFSPRQAAILTVLCDAGEPLSTTEVRERINRGRDRALVAEQVYRALVGLQQIGAVRRVHVADSRKAFWEAAVEVTHEEVS